MNGIKTKGDSLLPKCRNAIDTVFNMEITSNEGIRKYENLNPTYSVVDRNNGSIQYFKVY